MTSWERLYALYKSIHYVIDNRVPGDLVECGVWRGGSMALTALTLLAAGVRDRKLYLYDTFEGMTRPDQDIDIDLHGNLAIRDWEQIERRGAKWSYASLDEVRETMAQTGYPMENVIFVQGKVEQTLPGVVPTRISLLRLDTDWYASTKQEMEVLYPLLSLDGVLILDDYGHYQGAKRAVDEYLSKISPKPLLQRIDYSCRVGLKPRG